MKKTAVIALVMTVGVLCGSGCMQKNKNSDVANSASSPDTASVLQTGYISFVSPQAVVFYLVSVFSWAIGVQQYVDRRAKKKADTHSE